MQNKTLSEETNTASLNGGRYKRSPTWFLASLSSLASLGPTLIYLGLKLCSYACVELSVSSAVVCWCNYAIRCGEWKLQFALMKLCGFEQEVKSAGGHGCFLCLCFEFMLNYLCQLLAASCYNGEKFLSRWGLSLVLYSKEGSSSYKERERPVCPFFPAIACCCYFECLFIYFFNTQQTESWRRKMRSASIGWHKNSCLVTRINKCGE